MRDKITHSVKPCGKKNVPHRMSSSTEEDWGRAGMAFDDGNLDRIAILDSWRGVSVVFVIGGHLIDWHYPAQPNISGAASALAAVGVYIFFIIAASSSRSLP